MQKVFNITNRYIILATPLILYTLLSSVYLAAVSSNGKVLNLLFAVFLFVLMTAAFVAGWFNMIKIAILEPDREDINSMMGEFTSGVGEYFLQSLGAIITISTFAVIMIIGAYFIGINSIGDPGISSEAFSTAIKDTGSLKAFLLGLSDEQLMQLNLWNLLLLGTMSLTYFSLMLYLPAMFFKTKNPFVAFFISLKDLFSKKIIKTCGIFLLIFSANFFISVLTTLFSGIMVMHFIITLINFYFITVASVGIFYYYYHNFVKIGQNIDVKI